MCYRFGPSKALEEGFTDSNMSTDVDANWSTSGYVMTYVGGAVSWQSRLQKSVALSTTKVEYMVAMEGHKEVIWMDFIGELAFDKMNSDSTATVKVPSTLERILPTTQGTSISKGDSIGSRRR